MLWLLMALSFAVGTCFVAVLSSAVRDALPVQGRSKAG